MVQDVLIAAKTSVCDLNDRLIALRAARPAVGEATPRRAEHDTPEVLVWCARCGTVGLALPWLTDKLRKRFASFKDSSLTERAHG